MKKILTMICLSLLILSCGTAQKSTTNNTTDHTEQSSGIKYSGGDGSTKENAIIIKGAKSSFDGIKAEYSYIENKLGPRGKDWKMISQALINDKGKSYDLIKINNIKENKDVEYYFDISDFFGKF